MAKTSDQLIAAAGESTPIDLATLSNSASYVFPNDWEFTFDGLTKEPGEPYETFENVTIDLDFSSAPNRSKILRRQNSTVSTPSDVDFSFWSSDSSFTVEPQSTGTKTITVTYDDGFNPANTESIDIQVTSSNNPPDACIQVVGSGNFSVDFDAACSSDPDAGDSLEYRFDEGPTGSYNTGWQSSSTYSALVGQCTSVTVKVQVRDEELATDTDEATGSSDGCGGGELT
jgi:hypothetical protein